MTMKKAHGPFAKDEVGETGTVRERNVDILITLTKENHLSL